MRREDLPPLPARDAATDAAWRTLHRAACEPYRQAGHWAQNWARGKLARDPVFRGLLERGDLPAHARVLDLGCGQGLMASMLLACGDLAARGAWPAAWPAPPSALAYTGIELMAAEVARGQTALQGRCFAGGSAPRLVCADMRHAALPACDLVLMLDVLHYVDHPAQEALLHGLRGALASGGGPGRMLLRVGDAADRRRYAVSQWVDRLVTGARGHAQPPTWGRPLAAWQALLVRLGFTVRSVPMSQGTPFANVLLVADLPAPGSAR